MPTKELTRSGKCVTVRTINLGQNFACFAVIERRGKRLAETRNFPFGFDAAAHDAALAKLADL